ncbi:rhodanese-like domain-containing protein [Meiothermus sp. QL-1]|uniref:rhodanese-like domain-containing protein n=1 Tax=Meiothermus sp. QL-1 TaxID=2058095 RepID=UPI000E0BC267|nr:rhodanese-like domain-containing protein [Meiothermus sp. QL-1]RDI95107.1 rhodanese-like domain-containing protein [Meiothermus sp. QL-1]
MNLNVKEAYQTLERYQVVDVREPHEWAEGVLPGALRLPLSKLERLAPLYLERERPVLLYCRSGNRSQEALKTLQNLGHKKVWQLEGGLKAWREAGLPCASPV